MIIEHAVLDLRPGEEEAFEFPTVQHFELVAER